MKAKKLTLEELKRSIEDLHKDPELMEIAKKFVANLGSKA